MEIDPLIFRLSIFILSIFVGYYVVWSVTPSLHTPLMSVTRNPPKILIAAKAIAKKPNILEVLNTLPKFPDKPAIIAPTIITEEIALVTDIKGVCKDGVTLQTT